MFSIRSLPETLPSLWLAGERSALTKFISEAAVPNGEKQPNFLRTDDLVYRCSDLIRQVCQALMEPDEAVKLLKEWKEKYANFPNVLADELQLFEGALDTANSTSSLIKLVQFLVTEKVLTLPDIRERFDQEFLQALGFSDKASAWDTKYVRTKTKLYYKLQKYNLYREESEGYVALFDLLDRASISHTTEELIDEIFSLAGRFDMDVYRIVETILTSAYLAPQQLFPILFQFCCAVDFDVATLLAMIGAKFRWMTKFPTRFAGKIQGLCELVCLLIENGICGLEEILPYVPFDQDRVVADWDTMMEKAVAEHEFLHTTKRSVKEMMASGDKKAFEAFAEFVETLRNPRIDLAVVMFRHGMYHDAMRVVNQMPLQYATSFQPLAMEVAKMVHYILDPLVGSVSGADSVMGSREPENLPRIINDQLPSRMQSMEQIGEVVPWLMMLGSNVVYDRMLVATIVRLFEGFLLGLQTKQNEMTDSDQAADPSSGIVYEGLTESQRMVFREILHITEHCILPALTRGSGTSGLSEMIFGMLRCLEYNIRFTLYYKLKTDFYPHGHPLGIIARAVSLSNAKWFQKRVNKDNFKYCGRLVAKDMYNNPAVVCSFLAERIGAYDNFGALVTDALKSTSTFAADVMLYSVLEYMASNNSRKHDQMTIMPWFKFTAQFCANFVKRLPLDVEPIIEYVVGMLKSDYTVDLLVLKELVHKMSGIEVSEGATDEQLEALAGGDVLRAEGAYFTPMRNTKRSTIRLKATLLKTNQAFRLCLLISHVESNILYKENDGKNLKLVGLLYDMCHDTLVQYGSFLAASLSPEEYADNFPTLAELIHQYRLPFETSIFLVRSVFFNDIQAKLRDFRNFERIPDGPLSEQKPAKLEGATEEPLSDFERVQQRFSEIFDSVITSVVDLITPVMTQAPMEDISLRFYVIFWLLSLYDLYVPDAVYEQEMRKMRETAEKPIVEQEIGAVLRLKKEKARAEDIVKQLQKEMAVQRQHVRMLRNHLEGEKERWFQSTKTNKSDVVSQFLQMCVLPRATFSTIDALYSAHFIARLHELRTLNFSTLLCYDRMLCDITTALMCCSENEASRYGRMLHTVLKTIMRWHSNKATFDAECQNHPGFMTKFRTPTVSTGTDVVDHIDYENFRHVCHKWHFKLTKAMVSCLESESFIRIRNGLVVLDRILPYFPVVSNFYAAIEKRVQNLVVKEKDKRPDIYILAFGYMGRLRSQKSGKLLMPEDQFHLKQSDKSERKPARPSSIATEPNSKDSDVMVPEKKEKISAPKLDDDTKAAQMFKEITNNAAVSTSVTTSVEIKKEKDASRATASSESAPVAKKGAKSSADVKKNTPAESAQSTTTTKASGSNREREKTDVKPPKEKKDNMDVVFVEKTSISEKPVSSKAKEPKKENKSTAESSKKPSVTDIEASSKGSKPSERQEKTGKAKEEDREKKTGKETSKTERKPEASPAHRSADEKSTSRPERTQQNKAEEPRKMEDKSARKFDKEKATSSHKDKERSQNVATREKEENSTAKGSSKPTGSGSSRVSEKEKGSSSRIESPEIPAPPIPAKRLSRLKPAPAATAALALTSDIESDDEHHDVAASRNEAVKSVKRKRPDSSEEQRKTESSSRKHRSSSTAKSESDSDSRKRPTSHRTSSAATGARREQESSSRREPERRGASKADDSEREGKHSHRNRDR